MDKTIIVWNSVTGLQKKALRNPTEPAYSLAALPNGDLVSSSDASIKVCDMKTWQVKQILETRSGAVKGLIALPNGDLMSGSRGGEIFRWFKRIFTQSTLLI